MNYGQFENFCDDVFDAVRQINRRQAGLVACTRLDSMGIGPDELPRMVQILNERCEARMPEEEHLLWTTCQDVCESLAKHGGTPSWKHR